jgi:hypothetical protein
MKLPYQNKNSQKGQILIVFLLVLVIGLAIALSIASRSVTDVQQTTTSDESNRAYFAAEAGVENALKKIEDGSITTSTIASGGGKDTTASLNLTSTNRSNSDVSVKDLSIASGVVFEYPASLSKDEVAQVNLMENFNNVTTACSPGCVSAKGIRPGDTLDIYWDESGSTKQPAIEVSIVTCDAPCTNSSNFNMYKMAFDPSAAVHGNNFCTGGAIGVGGVQTTNLGNSINFRYRVSMTLTSNVYSGFSCPANDVVTGGQAPVLARVRMLYESGIKLAVGNGANRLPNQGYQVESLGKTGSGVARKLIVNRLYPSLPAVFDYVLYNGSSSNPLSKP